MSTLSQFVATLRLASGIYLELSGQGEDAPAGLDFEVAGRLFATTADLIEKLAHDLVVEGAEAPIAGTLGDWRAGMASAAVVRVLEEELFRVGDEIYRSDLGQDIKRVVEPVLEANEAVILALGGSTPDRIDGFALEPDIPVIGLRRKGRTRSTERQEEVDGYPVWYGTNRKPIDPDDPKKGFGNARGGSVSHGNCVVHVPKSHKIGSLGSSALIRLLSWSDDRLKIRVIEKLTSEEFRNELDARVAAAENGRRHAVVFIHGYNVSFEEAALRAAQLGHDLGIDGGMAFFSWPSKGRLRSYFADGDSIAASTGEITDFLVSVATLPSVEEVHLIAHSMGNRGTLAAVNRIAAAAQRLSGRRFSQFILAAADVDADVFRKEAGAYLQLGDRTTLYVSDRDQALEISSIISEYDRIGYHPPVGVVAGFDTVDVGEIDLDRLGHGYVGNNRGVLTDIHQLIFDNKPASERFGLEERKDEKGAPYWAFKP